MDYKKEFYRKKINEFCNSYKAVLTLSTLAVKENRVCSVIKMYDELKRIFKNILEIIRIFDSKEVLEFVQNMNFDEIPLELKEIKSLEYYNKLMALEYSNLTPENINDEIKILKMSIDFDWSEKLHFIKLAQLFYKEKKYKEAIMLAKYLVTVSETPPPWLVLAKSYRDLGMYGESIEAYKIYTGMNENDKEAKQEYVDMLDKIVGFEE